MHAENFISRKMSMGTIVYMCVPFQMLSCCVFDNLLCCLDAEDPPIRGHG